MPWSKAAIAAAIGVFPHETEPASAAEAAASDEFDTESLVLYLAYLLHSPLHDKARTFLQTHVSLTVDLKEKEVAEEAVSPSSSPKSPPQGYPCFKSQVPTQLPLEQMNVYQRTYVEALGRLSQLGCEAAAAAAGGGDTRRHLQPYPHPHPWGCLTRGCSTKPLHVNRELLAKLAVLDDTAELDRSHTYVGNVGLRALLPALHTARNLATLRLRQSGMQTDSLYELCALLEANPAVTDVDVSGNDLLAAEAGKRLTACVRQCTQVVRLEVGQCTLPAAYVHAIAAAVARNRRLANLPALPPESGVGEQCKNIV